MHGAEKFSVQKADATGVVSNLRSSACHSLQSRRNRIPPTPCSCLLGCVCGGAPSLSSATSPPENPPKSGRRQTLEPPNVGFQPSPGTASSPRQHPSPPWEGSVPVWVWFLKKIYEEKKRKAFTLGLGWADCKQGPGSEAAGRTWVPRSAQRGRGVQAHLARGQLPWESGQSFTPARSRLTVSPSHSVRGPRQGGRLQVWGRLPHHPCTLAPAWERGCPWATF